MLATKATLLAAVALEACMISTPGEPTTSYVEVSSAPIDVSMYPRTYYEGRDVYLVDNRWMYRDGGRWVYYRREPDVLVRQRGYIQQAPPAYGSPPAVRVR